jgi:hypothetical protein
MQESPFMCFTLGLQELSAYLIQKFGKGFSVTNLKQMRKFYKVYVTSC